MKRYRCDECDFECKLEMSDSAPHPDACVDLGHDVEWIVSIIIQAPSEQPDTPDPEDQADIWDFGHDPGC